VASLPDLRELAIEILLTAKAIEECPEHPHVTMTLDDRDALSLAYAIGTNRAKRGEVVASIAELRSAIETAYADSASDCPDCEREKKRV
jgi:hypothetical protein